MAARIYVLGILEMQRHPQAAALFRDLQQARAESDVLQVLHSAMQMLPGLTSVGYCQRVRQRLLEALPLSTATRSPRWEGDSPSTRVLIAA